MPADVAETVWYNEDSASPLTVSKPAAFAAGQLLIVVTVHDASAGLADLTADAGWTNKGSYNVTGSQGKVWSHPHDGGEPASWGFGYNGGASMCAGLFRITDPDPATTVVVTSRTIASNAASEDSPSLNPTGPDDLLLCLLANTGGNSAFSSTHPSGMTDLGQTQFSNLYMGLAAAKELLPNSSATGVRTWTSVSPTGRQGGALSIAVASVSAEPPGPRRLPWLTR